MTFCNLQASSHPCLVTSEKVQKGKNKKGRRYQIFFFLDVGILGISLI